MVLSKNTFSTSGAIEKLIMMDTSHDMVKRCKDAEKVISNDNIETSYMIADEEFLPVKERYHNEFLAEKC